MKLTKSNCKAFKVKESGNIYISHPLSKVNIRLMCEESELVEDWRDRVVLRESGYNNGFYAILAQNELVELDV